MRPFHVCAHCGRVVQTEQVVSIVDHHIELAQKIFAEDSAKMEIDGLGILDVKHEYLLVGDRMGAGFEQVELREGSGCLKCGSCYDGRALRIQVELSGQRGVDHRHLGAGIQDKVRGAGVVDGYHHNHLVPVCETAGQSCDNSRAMRFCVKCRDDGCHNNEGSEPLEV